MTKVRLWRGWLVAVPAAGSLFAAAPGAQAAGSDPLFVFVPKPPPFPPALPPPLGVLEGPCGMGVDPLGHFYVSDYYHDVIDIYDQNANYNTKSVNGATGYLVQLTGIDPLDGPCGLAFDASGLYVNDYHRAVIHYSNIFAAPTTLTGATTPEATHPTGVDVDPTSANVYVDQRDHVSVFDESGAPLEEIGAASLKDGYGVAYSQYPATAGYLYVPDAATNTIKVYDPATDKDDPIAEIDGSQTPEGEFVSLRDASVAVDRVTGEVYVIDDLQPEHTEFPQAIVDVFHPDGTYEGHLKSLVTWGMPSGLAVDNSETSTQGRVYVTSGNSIFGAIYAYGPEAATTEAIKLPAALSPPPPGESGALSGEPLAPGCPACEKEAAALSADNGFAATAAGKGAAPAALPSAGKRHKPNHHRKARQRKAHRAHHRGVRRAK